jgi:hypothetical protein
MFTAPRAAVSAASRLASRSVARYTVERATRNRSPKVGGAVLSGSVQCYEVSFLARVCLGCLPLRRALAFAEAGTHLPRGARRIVLSEGSLR